ncbi:hypothetical protein FQN49_002045 [Arthroderma sp. PD_2]|nr:hypothetical protein FQN49_002045 [Arthroderma sp. PD_2]
MESPSTFRLLDLPLELRLEIYSYCVVLGPEPSRSSRFPDYTFRCGYCPTLTGEEEKALLAKERRKSNQYAILRVSKQISSQCLDLLYGKNMIQICYHPHLDQVLENSITLTNRSKMRDITVIVQSNDNKPPVEALWASIIPGLKRLCIIAHGSNTGFDKLPMDQYLRVDQEWLESLLECFAKCLKPRTAVILDDNGDAVVAGTAKKFFAAWVS